MSLSRAEVEAMDRDELVDEIIALDRRLQDTQALVYERLKPTLDELEDRIGELEAENQRLRERLDDSNTKDAKVADIVEYADGARDGRPAVKLTAKEIAGAAGISKRYAYDLMDAETGLPAEYDWALTPAEMRQYGSIEIDNADERRLGIDFEGVHSAGVPLNKFNTGTEGEG